MPLLQLEDQGEAPVGNEREGVRGVDRLRGQHREDLLAEMLVEPGLGLFVERFVADDVHACAVERGLKRRPNFVLAGDQPVGFRA